MVGLLDLCSLLLNVIGWFEKYKLQLLCTAYSVYWSRMSNVSVHRHLQGGLVVMTAGCNVSSDLHVLTCGPAATLPNDSTTATSYQATIKGVAVGAHTVSASVTVARDQDATNNAAQSTVTVTATCQHYDSSGGWFPCGAKFKANTANAGSPSPDKPTCCVSASLCGSFRAHY